MALLVPNEGEAKILAVALGKDAAEDLSLKLYSNDYTPVEASTGSSFTEVTGYGYAAITCTAANWTVVAGAPSTATCAVKTFTFTGAAGNIYGYYVVGASSGIVYWAERLASTPEVIQNSGDQVVVTLSISLD